jgi:signal transduction histidine kinase
MVDSTLAFTREEANSEGLASVDLVSLLQNICEEREEATLVVGPGIESRLPYVCRPMALTRCLSNVVENAVKYGQRASVRLLNAPGAVTVEVDDEGPGIPLEDHERVFAPFVRLDASRSRDTGGTGLGLTIARTIARAHGGDVTVANRPGSGLRVTISLPR